MAPMLVGVIDVGGNSLRLLVAQVGADRVRAVHDERSRLRLAADVERYGYVSQEKLERTARLAGRYARRARKLGVHSLSTVVTSPARQSTNGDELVAALAEAVGGDVRRLGAEEEAFLAFRGAVASQEDLDDPVAVCDVGGGSAQLAFGTSEEGPTWSVSLDIGSLRLTERFLKQLPPSRSSRRDAEAAAAAAWDGVMLPEPNSLLATGGTARGVGRIAGRRLDEEQLGRVLELLAKRPPEKLVRRYGFDQERARTLFGGALILAELQRRVGVPLVVTRGGLRQGVLLDLARAQQAA